MGATIFVLMRSFANGGSSLTGVEAISNGVSAFKPPEGIRARQGLRAYERHARRVGAGDFVLGQVDPRGAVRRRGADGDLPGGAGGIRLEPHRATLFYIVQFATLLILYTGGNTSFNGFPFLASFVAGDRFLPRQLTRRGHRLTFSNGIIVLATIAIALLVVTAVQRHRLSGRLRHRRFYGLHHGRGRE